MSALGNMEKENVVRLAQLRLSIVTRDEDTLTPSDSGVSGFDSGSGFGSPSRYSQIGRSHRVSECSTREGSSGWVDYRQWVPQYRDSRSASGRSSVNSGDTGSTMKVPVPPLPPQGALLYRQESWLNTVDYVGTQGFVAGTPGNGTDMEPEDTDLATEEERLRRELVNTRKAPVPPVGYICFACYKPGHYIRDCMEKAGGPNATTPYQGPKRCVGRFQCTNTRCNHAWVSQNSYANKYQFCNKCRAKVFPKKQEPPKDDSDTGTALVDFSVPLPAAGVLVATIPMIPLPTFPVAPQGFPKVREPGIGGKSQGNFRGFPRPIVARRIPGIQVP